VTSAVLSPRQATNYLGDVLAKIPQITVAGIAGPGDPFANTLETLETIRLVKERFPGLLLCLSSNGLGVPAHLDEIAELGVTHMTITINAVDPVIGQRFYRWVREGKVLYSGLKAAEFMLKRQREALRGLKDRRITVKVNTIVAPGINDAHVEDVARTVADFGVDLHNLIALYPTEDTAFADLTEPSKELMETLRSKAEVYLPQMRHCKRCRSDAVGLLDYDHSYSLAECLREHARSSPVAHPERPHVAVASNEGVLVNRHLGETTVFQIWTKNADGFARIEDRPAPSPGGGLKRWLRLAEVLGDCRAILSGGIGETPREALEKSGLKSVVMSGFIEAGLAAIYEGRNPAMFKSRNTSCGKRTCACSGDGCA